MESNNCHSMILLPSVILILVKIRVCYS
uniref:Uncharacterized protein n=1 Tax=Arundo donax TaxID=35708 RepID=A0A0A8ZZY8_ARUDO